MTLAVTIAVTPARTSGRAPAESCGFFLSLMRHALGLRTLSIGQPLRGRTRAGCRTAAPGARERALPQGHGRRAVPHASPVRGCWRESRLPATLVSARASGTERTGALYPVSVVAKVRRAARRPLFR